MRIRSMFRNLVSLVLLLPLLAGMLGISAKEHRCSSSNKSSVKMFPELTGQIASCCCSQETVSQPRAGDAGKEDLDAPDCCKTIRLYFKADFQSTRAQAMITRLISPPASDCFLPGELPSGKAVEFQNISFYTDTGPPLTGRERIISFHQTKIPCPSFLHC
ncbi:MAG: hypothetical protein WCK92_12385 [Bacteroidota bacterium]